MAARPVHFLRIGSFWGAFRGALRPNMESPSLILFRLRCSSFKPRQSPWIVTRCTCLESFAGCCPGCLGRPNSPNCELKSKWYVCEDFHLVWSVYQIVWTSALILWSDLDLIPSANLTLNHAPPPRLSCFTPRAHTSNGILPAEQECNVQRPWQIESKQKGELWDGHTSSAHRLQHTKWCGVLRNW